MRTLSIALVACGLAMPALAHAQSPEELLLLRIQRTPKERLDPLINDLSRGHGPRVPFVIARLLEDPVAEVRMKAAYLLGFLDRTPRLAPRLVVATRDEDWEVRKEALFALRRHGSPRDVPAVTRTLFDPKRPVRVEAIRTLAHFKGPKAARALRAALDKVGDDREIEIQLLGALGDVGDRRSIPVLRRKLESKSETVRLAATRGLALLGDPKARGALLSGLRAPEPYQRQDAASLLARIEAPWARRPLRRAFSHEADPRTKILLAEALAAQGGRDGLRYLVSLSELTEGDVAVWAAEALDRLDVSASERERIRQELAPAPLVPDAPGGGAGAPAPPGRPAGDPAAGDQVRAKIRSLRARPGSFEERVDAFAAAFEGVPYVLSPLGEGAGYDPDPLLRYDAVDCLTYVEEVLALANTPGDDPLPALLDLRYARGRPSFGERNHLMISEWIPRNVQKGYLRDITRQVGGGSVVEATKTVDEARWRGRRGVDLPLDASEVPLGTFSLPIIPIDAFPSVMGKIPSGTILLVVRRDLPARPYRVTHLGFVVRRGGHLYLRHAAKAGYQKVVDERLETFVQRNARYRKWPVAGFHLLRPLPNEARVAQLTRASGPAPLPSPSPAGAPGPAPRRGPSGSR